MLFSEDLLPSLPPASYDSEVRLFFRRLGLLCTLVIGSLLLLGIMLLAVRIARFGWRLATLLGLLALVVWAAGRMDRAVAATGPLTRATSPPRTKGRTLPRRTSNHSAAGESSADPPTTYASGKFKLHTERVRTAGKKVHEPKGTETLEAVGAGTLHDYLPPERMPRPKAALTGHKQPGRPKNKRRARF